MESASLKFESYFAPVGGGRLHLRRIYRNALGPAVLMLHGSIENGKIFYSHKGQGLGPYLARQGYDVFAADLRGRGESTPSICRDSEYGQHEAITEDLPAAVELVKGLRGEAPRHWIAHSWGGVLMASHLARFPERAESIDSMVFFASKRCIRSSGWEKFLKVEVFWNRAARLLTALCGYLPARELRIGSDNETRSSHDDCRIWVKPGPWIDPQDGFDYGLAARRLKLPPTLHLTGFADAYLGNPRDVRDFMREMGEEHCEYRILSRANGNLHDYSHLDILTHPDATRDHFPRVVEWLQNAKKPLPDS